MVIPTRLEGYRVLVTGATRGIGQAILESFIESGAIVSFCYSKDPDRAMELVSIHGESVVFPFRSDIADMGCAQSLVDQAFGAMGGLDILVNNAGIYPHAKITDTTNEMLARVHRINFEAPFVIIKKALPHLASRPGSIINITSINAFAPEANMAAYDASKAALTALTRTAALEMGPYGIRVNAIAPGLVWDPTIESTVPERVRAFKSHSPLGRLVKPKEVAQAVMFLSSDAASAITGQTIVVDAGVTLAGYMHGLE